MGDQSDFPLIPIKATPYQHQRDAFAFSRRMFGMDGGSILSQGAALLMEMGTGKTITSIAITGALYLDKKIRRVLVVAPLSIVGVWDEEFAKFADFDYTLAVLSGTGAKKSDTLRHMRGASLQVAVVNYESAWRLEKEILAWQPDLVIADEGHKIKTHNIAASKAMHKIGAKAAYRLLLTGTVITNRALDVFSQYKFLNPSIYGNSFYSFRNRYFDMVGYGNHTPVLKRSMEQDLMKRLHSIAFRATKAECLDLPETTDIIRYVELESAAAKVYRDLVKDSYAELGKSEVTVTNILTRLLRLSQLTGGFIGDDEGSAMREAGYHWSSTIIWAKDSLVLSRKDYHTQYEPLWYGWLEGGAKTKRICPLKDRKQSDLWQIPRPKVSAEHPTMKPIALVAKALLNSSRTGDIVLDLFGGSGTTLIAAEQTERVCRMMELDSKYTDVIVRRFIELTGSDEEVYLLREGHRSKYAEVAGNG